MDREQWFPRSVNGIVDVEAMLIRSELDLFECFILDHTSPECLQNSASLRSIEILTSTPDSAFPLNANNNEGDRNNDGLETDELYDAKNTTEAWNYFHINSVDKDDEGSYLISPATTAPSSKSTAQPAP